MMINKIKYSCIYNMKSTQKEQKDNSEERRQRLIEEISEIRQKISQLDYLQQQIETIESLIKLEQSKSSKISVSSHSGSTKKIQPKSTRNSNSNKKIKIYELNKKLEGRQKQYKDKHVCYMGRLRKHEEQMVMITETDHDIRKERDNSRELDLLHASLLADINRMQEKCNESEAMLASEQQVLALCQQQKIKHIKEIKRLKKIINNSAQNTEPDEIAYSVHQPEEDQDKDNKIKPLIFKFDLTEQNSRNLLSQNRKQEQILIEQSDQTLVPAYISFKKSHHHRLTQSPPMNSLNNSKQDCQNKELGRSYEQLEHEITVLEDKIEKDQKLYESLLQSVSLVKRGNRNLEASAKHLIVTLDLLKNRLESAVRNNQQENRELLDHIEKYNELYNKLRSKEGERGQLRGKLGIKVQNTRILGIVNEQINLDLHKISHKVPVLKNLSVECLEMVKRLMGPEKIIIQSLNDS